MNSLIGYGSDDDCDSISQPKKSSSQADANYEEVQMDLSEESNDSSKPEGHHRLPSRAHRERSHSRGREYNNEDREKYSKRSPDDYRSKYDHESERNDKYKGRSKNEDDRYKGKEDRERDYRKDRNRDDRSRYRDDKYRKDRDSKRDDYRDDRKSHRNSSRERHRSRSPKRSSYRDRRSNSRDRSSSGGYNKRYDRASSKMDRLEKLGIEISATTSSRFSNTNSPPSQVSDKDQDKNRFFMPGITGRFTEQIQRRKMLWQKKDSKEEPVKEPTVVPVATAVTPHLSKNWQNTTFAQDTDGKVANKFKRLMGIRGNDGEALKADGKPDVLKKQEEMFNSMEAQYEVARTATHTMRGVGLGFGSFQR